MSILLLGYKGYLGSFLYDNLECDIEDQDTKYDFIINCIGKPDLDFCEKNPDLSENSNYKILIPYAEKHKEAKIINFSSYYVYNSAGLCTEYSATTDKYVYTKHKLLSEQLVTSLGGVTFRLGKLFGHADINKQYKLTEYIIKNNVLTLDSVLFNPTSLYQVLDVVKHWIHSFKPGIYNLSNLGITSHYDYGVYINDLLHTKKRIRRADQTFHSFSNYGKFCMNSSKLDTVFPLRDWKEDMNKYIKDLKLC